MKDYKWDEMKTLTQLKKEHDKICSVPGCGCPLTQMQGLGSDSLCREHQIQQREYGGMGRLDRPHTFHRAWQCDVCGYDPLEDPRIKNLDVSEDVKRRIARFILIGDHIQRRADGGQDIAENINTLCPICNAVKTIVNEDYLCKNTPV